MPGGWRMLGWVSASCLVIGQRPRNPWLKPWGGKGGYLLRWFSTYCLTISKGAPPTVATK